MVIISRKKQPCVFELTQFVRQNTQRKARMTADSSGGRCETDVCVSLLVSYLYGPPLIKCQ